MTKTERDLTDGRRHQEAGEFAKAGEIFRKVLKREPANIHAKFFLGALMTQMGQHTDSVKLLKEVVATRPEWEEAHNNLAVALQQAGLIAESIEHYEKAIELNPDFVEPYSNMSFGLQILGRYEYALTQLNKAIELVPDRRDTWINHAQVLRALGREEEAKVSAKRAFEVMDDSLGSYKEVGGLLTGLKMWDEAFDLYEKCTELYADFAPAYNLLASILEKKITPYNRSDSYERMGKYLDKSVEVAPDYLDGQFFCVSVLLCLCCFDEAKAIYDRFADIFETRFDAMNNYGALLQDRQDFNAAIECCKKAIGIDPTHAEPYYNWGSCLQRQGRYEEALEKYAKAVELKPEHIDTRSARALLYLTIGNFGEGWKDYEWRKQTGQFSGRLIDEHWIDPKRLAGQRIFIHAEQGQGDMFQFVRYGHVIKAAGGHVLVECHDGLRDLIKTCPWVDEVRERSDGGDIVYDYQANLMSLPWIFDTEVDSIPSQVPYLSAPEAYRPKWAARIAELTPEGTRLKVGIVWAGNPDHHNDAQRSTTLEKFGMLADIPGVTFFSLQKGERPESELANPPAGMKLVTLNAEIDNFNDTAAILENLDLLITVDTSVAHLAGAMGLPVWMMLPYANDFRWMTEREDTPWYPTMRLFRPRKMWDFDHVFERVHAELERYVDDPVAWNINDATQKFDRGEQNRAKVQLLALASKYGSDTRLINSIGELLWADGNTQEAMQMFVAAMQMDPTDRRSIANVAHILDLFGQRTDAQALYQSYMSSHPDDNDFAEALSGLRDEPQLAAA